MCAGHADLVLRLYSGCAELLLCYSCTYSFGINTFGHALEYAAAYWSYSGCKVLVRKKILHVL